MYLMVCSYMIEGEVCYLVLCEQGYSKKSAFTYLEDIAREFGQQYGHQVAASKRPYSFIEFGEFFTTLIIFFIIQRPYNVVMSFGRDRNSYMMMLFP